MKLTPESFQIHAVKSIIPRAPSHVIQKILQEFDAVFSKKEPVKVAASLPPAEIVTTCRDPIRPT